MEYQQITVNAALIGAVVSILLQALKLLPPAWLQTVLSQDEKTQKLRMRALVFIVTAIAVFATGMATSAISWSNWYDSAYMLIIALTSSYTTYQTVVSMVADKFPEQFKVSE